jgi:hypothetical protein
MRDELESTTRAVIAADEIHLDRAADDILWERRGLLQSLARTDRPGAGWWRRALRFN